MRTVARRFVTLLAAVVAGMLLGALIGGVIMGGGWGEGMIFGGMGGAVLGILYDPRAATYTVPTRGGAEYPGGRDD
jgi:membrane associated rhomboid family serine protease